MTRRFCLILGLMLGACGSHPDTPRAGLTPLTDPRDLTLSDMALLASPPPGAGRIDCKADAEQVAQRLANADAFAGSSTKLVAWGMRAVGPNGKGGELWTLERELTDRKTAAVQIVQRDYLVGKGCAWWAINQKVLEWRRGGTATRAGEGRVLIH